MEQGKACFFSLGKWKTRKKLLLSFAILICFSGCAEICGEVDAIKPLKRDFHDIADGVGRLIEYFYTFKSFGMLSCQLWKKGKHTKKNNFSEH